MKSVVYRTHRRNGFATISLACIEDPEIPALAKLLHTYAISRPDGWELRMTDLIRRFHEGERAIYSAFKKLEKSGYLRRERTLGRREDGRTCFGEVIYHWYEKPSEAPDELAAPAPSPPAETAVAVEAHAEDALADLTYDDPPLVGIPNAATEVHSINHRSIHHREPVSMEQGSTHHSREVCGDTFSEKFESFWRKYPRRDAKKESWRRWCDRVESGVSPDLLLRACGNYADYVREARIDERYVMYPMTFLGPEARYEEWKERRLTYDPARGGVRPVSEDRREQYRQAVLRGSGKREY